MHWTSFIGVTHCQLASLWKNKGTHVHLWRIQEQQFPLAPLWLLLQWDLSSDWQCASARDYSNQSKWSLSWSWSLNILKKTLQSLPNTTVPPLDICGHQSYALNLDDVLYPPSENETGLQNIFLWVHPHSLQLSSPSYISLWERRRNKHMY